MQYGDTYYGKFGFRPYDDDLHIPDKTLTKIYLHNKELIKKLTVTNCYGTLKKHITFAFTQLKNSGLDLDKILY